MGAVKRLDRERSVNGECSHPRPGDWRVVIHKGIRLQVEQRLRLETNAKAKKPACAGFFPHPRNSQAETAGGLVSSDSSA